MAKPILFKSLLNADKSRFMPQGHIMSALGLAVLGLAVLTLPGCAQTPKFTQKAQQTDRAFATDQAYCRSQALGQNNDDQGVSTLHLRLKMSGNVGYDDCMKAMGYKITE